MTTEEIGNRLRQICRTSETEDELRLRIQRDLGYQGSVSVTPKVNGTPFGVTIVSPYGGAINV